MGGSGIGVVMGRVDLLIWTVEENQYMVLVMYYVWVT